MSDATFAAVDEWDTPDTLVGISFDDPFRAQEFLTAMTRLSSTGDLMLRDAVVLAKDDDGKTSVRETVDLGTGRTALSGAVWTGLLGLLLGGPVGWLAGLGIGAGAGAVTAKIVDVGVPDEWVAWFREAVQPGTFTVVVLATALNIETLVSETTRFPGGHLVYANLPPDTVNRLERSMGDDLHDVPDAGDRGLDADPDSETQLPPPTA
jgi:uncharacterized membrane protein